MTTRTGAIVGPVLQATPLGRAIVAAIRDLNRDVTVIDRGAYLRVHATDDCVVTKEAIAKHAKAEIVLPGDLEREMVSFQGELTIDETEVRWTQPRGGAR